MQNIKFHFSGGLVFQSDGNLVLYEIGGGAIWNSGPTSGVKLVVTNKGNLKLLDAAEKSVWSIQASGKFVKISK